VTQIVSRTPLGFRSLWGALPSAGARKDSLALRPVVTFVTAADDAYWRCLFQFLKSARRRKFAGRYRFVVFDLGLSEAHRELLQKTFPWAVFRKFAFEDFPAHVVPTTKIYAWKPIAVAQAAAEFGGLLFWLDSATVLKTSNISSVLDELERNGIYTLKGHAPISERCDPQVLKALRTPLEFLHLKERVSGVVGFDTRKPAVRELIAQWCDRALDPSLIPPRAEGNNPDQALLSLLLFERAERGDIALGDGEVDISSAWPVRWLSTRNWVTADTPTWADPFERLRHFAYKTADQLSWRIKHWDQTRLDGFNRSLWEHFTVLVSRGDKTVSIKGPKAGYYADPFVWSEDGRDYVFVEEYDYRVDRAHISCVALDGELNDAPPISVIKPGTHLSFPLIFEADGALYMLPESCATRSIDLYICDAFPHKWRLKKRLMYGVDAADTAVLKHDGRWWLVTALREAGGPRYLGIFSSEILLTTEWEAHPINEKRLYADQPNSSYRNAGNILRDAEGLLRPVQINRDYYGEYASVMRIETLTRTEYREVPYAGSHPFAEIARACAPHHYSEKGSLSAWDVRDHVGYLNRAPARDSNGRLV